MLENTLILPETDARLAAQLFRDSVESLNHVLLLVFGKDERSRQLVEWADKLARKTRVSGTFNPRRVVWIRDDSSATLRKELDPILGVDVTPRVAMLNFHDKLEVVLNEGDVIDPVALEKAFAKGEKA
jgi:hypothetical protein